MIKKNNILVLGFALAVLISGLLLTGCLLPSGTPTSPGGQGGTGSSSWTLIIFLVLIFGMFYFLTIRPQRRRQKEHQKLMSDLKRGDRVVTAGGIYGEIERLDQDSVVIKVESGAMMRVARGSVVLKQ